MGDGESSARVSIQRGNGGPRGSLVKMSESGRYYLTSPHAWKAFSRHQLAGKHSTCRLENGGLSIVSLLVPPDEYLWRRVRDLALPAFGRGSRESEHFVGGPWSLLIHERDQLACPREKNSRQYFRARDIYLSKKIFQVAHKSYEELSRAIVSCSRRRKGSSFNRTCLGLSFSPGNRRNRFHLSGLIRIGSRTRWKFLSNPALRGATWIFSPPPSRRRPLTTTWVVRNESHRQKSSGPTWRHDRSHVSHRFPATSWLCATLRFPRFTNRPARRSLIAVNCLGLPRPPHTPALITPPRVCVWFFLLDACVFFTPSHRLHRNSHISSNFRAQVPRQKTRSCNARTQSCVGGENKTREISGVAVARVDASDLPICRRENRLCSAFSRRSLSWRYPSPPGRPIIRAASLTFTGPRRKEKSDRGMAEVLYKLDVSRIFPAHRCVSRCRFRPR